MRIGQAAVFLVVALVLLAGGLFFFVQNMGPAAAGEPFVARIAGLSEGDRVDYQIVSAQTPVLRGQLQADEDGAFKVPLFKDGQDGDVSYYLQITKDGKPLDVTLNAPAGEGAIKLSGKGAGTFSDIRVESAAGQSAMKSDWAGAFNVNSSDLAADLEAVKSFRVALFNNAVLSDVRENNPLIIEVMETAGGGGPTGDGLNEWDFPTDCGDKPYLSVCEDGGANTNHQIKEAMEKYVGSLKEMTEQFSAVMMQYVEIIGTFFDAKMQLETQRTMQTLQAEAHKDYHPSEQMCVFGSFVKSVASTESKARYDRNAFNKIMMERYTNADHSEDYQGAFASAEARIRQFRETYCDPKDHNNGLAFMCQHNPSNPAIESGEKIGGQNPERLNRDIDYTRLADSNLTLDIDFTDGVSSADEEDVIALANNLYWPEIYNVTLPKAVKNNPQIYMDARRLMAMNNVSHTTLAHIMSMKAQSAEGLGSQSGWSFMKALMRDFGLSDSEIVETLGERPSYYAQMEVLTKKLYQDPNFYTNLYDKPTNINRIAASMEAIKLMQMRDWYQTVTRRELLSSLLLEADLQHRVQTTNDEITDLSTR